MCSDTRMQRRAWISRACSCSASVFFWVDQNLFGWRAGTPPFSIAARSISADVFAFCTTLAGWELLQWNWTLSRSILRRNMRTKISLLSVVFVVYGFDVFLRSIVKHTVKKVFVFSLSFTLFSWNMKDFNSDVLLCSSTFYCQKMRKGVLQLYYLKRCWQHHQMYCLAFAECSAMH